MTTFTRETRLGDAVEVHERIIAAIATRDADGAASAARTHISKALATRRELGPGTG